MAYTSDRTGANIDRVLDDADEGNIGKTNTGISGISVTDASGFYSVADGGSDPNLPETQSFLNNIFMCSDDIVNRKANFVVRSTTDPSSMTAWFGVGTQDNTTYTWNEIYHTGNTGVVEFNGSSVPIGGAEFIQLGLNGGARCDFGRPGTSPTTLHGFHNDNGLVGSISTNGTATNYNTSSDPRLKDFKDSPTDEAIDSKFNSLFNSFAVFNWKSDPDGDLVWGFDAHKAVDNGLDLGSEGEGPRDLALGDVYDTTPAKFDDEGNEIEPEQKLKVTPAGVDQSKAVPILLAKLEQLERRIKELEA